MKRKTFIKQLMGLGISRNTANEAATAMAQLQTPLGTGLDNLRVVYGHNISMPAYCRLSVKEFDRCLRDTARRYLAGGGGHE